MWPECQSSYWECFILVSRSPHSSYDAVRQRNIKISSNSSQILHQKDQMNQIISELTSQAENYFNPFYPLAKTKINLQHKAAELQRSPTLLTKLRQRDKTSDAALMG